MRSVEEALAAILASARPTSSEIVGLDRCAGRAPVDRWLTARVDVPPFDNSSMDGFAVRSTDAPGTLRLTGEVAAGSAAAARVESGTAVRIMTGAPLPDGADAVVPLERAEERDGSVTVEAVEPGAFVRRAGEDTPAGAAVELPAARLGPAAVAVLASLGIAELAVHRRPRVAILSTGNELRAPGQPLAPGQVYDANAPALAAAVEEAGGQAVVLQRAADDAEAIELALRAALPAADLLVASGGVSVGEHDHVRPVIERLGELTFWRIRVQPGKPLAFGSIDGRPIIGLPGNPVSALVTFELFVRPLIRAMLGLAGTGRPVVRAAATERMAKDPDRRAYLRVSLRTDRSGYAAAPAGGQGSHQVRSLAASNALLVVPEGEPAAETGRAYDAILLGGVP